MFQKEEEYLRQARAVLEQQSAEPEAIEAAFRSLADRYEDLLKDSKFLAKIGDRLQNRIVKTNNELREAKQDLQEKIKERTAELVRTNQLLMAANDELDKFVYRASHDIKGPIMRMLGLTQLGQMDVADLKGKDYLARIEEVAESLDGILNLLLSVNNLKTLEPEPEVFPLANGLQKAFRVASEGLGDQTLCLKIEEQTQIGVICSDKQIFMIMMENIFSYALKSSLEAESAEAVKVRLSVKDSTILKMQISFKGVTLPMEVLERVFDMFFRTLNHQYHTGLELYAAEMGAEKLGGDVQLLKSERDETVFGIVLPLDLQMKI